MTRSLLTAAAAVATTAAVTLGTAGAAAASPAPPASAASPAARTHPRGHLTAPYLELGDDSLPDLSQAMRASGVHTYTLAFLVSDGHCGTGWEGAQDTATSLVGYARGVREFERRGGRVVVSFGGEGATEVAQTCTSVPALTAAYRRVADTYGTDHLDFDIEGDASLSDVAANHRRAAALAALQRERPGLTVDYTLPVAETGLAKNSLKLLRQNAIAGVRVHTVNIMTMDFGPGHHTLASSEQAAESTHRQLAGVVGGDSDRRWRMLGLTTIAGNQDPVDEQDPNGPTEGTPFTQADARTLTAFATRRGIGLLSYWEVDGYDKPLGYAYARIMRGTGR